MTKQFQSNENLHESSLKVSSSLDSKKQATTTSPPPPQKTQKNKKTSHPHHFSKCLIDNLNYNHKKHNNAKHGGIARHKNNNATENHNLKKKRLYASIDNLNCLSETLLTSLSSSSAKSLSLTTTNHILHNPLSNKFSSMNTNSTIGNSTPSTSLPSLSTGKLFGQCLRLVGNQMHKKTRSKKLAPRLKSHANKKISLNSSASFEAKEPVQVYSALNNTSQTSSSIKNGASAEKSEEPIDDAPKIAYEVSINSNSSITSNDIGLAEMTSNEIISLYSGSDKEQAKATAKSLPETRLVEPKLGYNYKKNLFELMQR